MKSRRHTRSATSPPIGAETDRMIPLDDAQFSRGFDALAWLPGDVMARFLQAKG